MGFLLPVVGAGAAAGGGGLSALGTIATVVGGLVGAAGSFAEGQAANDRAQYQAQVAEMNAEIERDNAERVRDAAQIEQQQSDLEVDQLLGEQLAAQSSSGIDVGSRSSLGARRAARVIGRRDALNIRQGAEVEAFGREVEAVNFDQNATLQRSAGRNALRSGALGAFGTLIGTASTLGSRRR